MHNYFQDVKHYHAVAAQFILIELRIAVTFCEVALATRDSATADRNAQNAESALAAALRLEKRIRLTEAEREEFASITLRLPSLLSQIRTRTIALPAPEVLA